MLEASPAVAAAAAGMEAKVRETVTGNVHFHVPARSAASLDVFHALVAADPEAMAFLYLSFYIFSTLLKMFFMIEMLVILQY